MSHNLGIWKSHGVCNEPKTLIEVRSHTLHVLPPHYIELCIILPRYNYLTNPWQMINVFKALLITLLKTIHYNYYGPFNL